MPKKILADVQRVLVKTHPRAISAGAALLCVVGFIDYANGSEWQVLPLYLLPLGLVTWGAGRRWGCVFAVLSVAIWFSVQMDLAAPHTNFAPPLWNAGMLLLVFLAMTFILSSLLQIMAELEKRVKDRTLQLEKEMERSYHAEQLQFRAERMAVLGSMAAQMAHEVRNPMSSISLNMELLSYEIASLGKDPAHSPVEANLLLAQMQKEFDRIGNVISGYLGFTHVPAIMPAPHPLHAYLDEKLALVAAELAQAQVRLVKEYDPAVTSADIDPMQMWQVLLNLIRNAREAMPHGGVLTVSTQQAGSEVKITLRDTGCGISLDDAARVFVPFYTTKAQGTGLGLALSQQIMAAHGGRMEFVSRPGEGAAFTLWLPLTQQPAHPNFSASSLPPHTLVSPPAPL